MTASEDRWEFIGLFGSKQYAKSMCRFFGKAEIDEPLDGGRIVQGDGWRMLIHSDGTVGAYILNAGHHLTRERIDEIREEKMDGIRFWDY